MRIEVLEYFLEIVRCQSFSQASTSLFISQQGLGKAMRALESELGIVIFRKNGRVLELTEEGAVLEEHAKRIVKQSEDLREALFKIQIETAETQEPLQVYATSYVCNAIYNLLESELIEYDLNNCSINELELNEILNAIDCGNTSFGLINILASDIAQLDDIGDIEFTPLLAMNITVKVPDSITSDYPAGSITVEQLSQLPLAYYNEPVLNKFVERTFKKPDGSYPTFMQHSTNIQRLNTLVQTQRAVTFSDTFTQSIRKPTDGIAFLNLLPSQKFVVGALESTDKSRNRESREYIHRLRALIQFKHRHYLNRHPL